MKKLICLVLALVCLMCQTAFAADALTVKSGNDGISYSSMTAVGNRVYLTAVKQEHDVLYYWEDGMETAALIGEPLQRTASYNAGSKDIPEHCVSVLMSDGKQLISVDPYHGKVFSITPSEGHNEYTDITDIAEPEKLLQDMDGDAYFQEPQNAFIQDGFIYWMMWSWEDGTREVRRLIQISMADGAVREMQVDHMYQAIKYRGNELLVIVWDEEHAYNSSDGTWNNPTVCTYDVNTGTVTQRGAYDELYLQSAVWSEQFNALIYVTNGRILGLKNMNEKQQFGFAPTGYLEGLQLLEDGRLAALSASELYIRPLKENFSTDMALNVYGSYFSDGARLFIERHPDIPVYFSSEYYSDMESLNQAMISGENNLDILFMDYSYSSFIRMMEKGYCMDLSGTPLAAQVERMYPVYRDAVSSNGKIYAVPTWVYGSGWRANKNVMKELGLTEEDIPDNLLDLFEFINIYAEDYFEDYPEYGLLDFNMGSTKMQMFTTLFNAYIAWCQQNGRDLSFDTPEFRQLMEAWDRIDTDDMDRMLRDEYNNDRWREPLLTSYYTTIGDFDWINQKFLPNAEEPQSLMLDMTLLPGMDAAYGVDMVVAFINPRSANQELALEYLQCCLERNDVTTNYCLFEDLTGAAENPNYEEAKKNSEDYLKTLLDSAEKETNPDSKQAYMDTYEQEKKSMETYLPTIEYLILAESSDYYRNELIPKVLVLKPSPFNTEKNISTEITTLFQRLMDRQIDLNGFIRELDSKLRMMRMENE